jgi:demethylmenaquinone methyltransferase/2-methoxy-6-polyprenyl-1,4-benzoquinol methylase
MKGFYLVNMKSEMERVTRSKEQARESYNAMSHWYDIFTSSEKRFTDIGIKMLDTQPNQSVLEIGCGTGYALTKFADKGTKVIAIDLSEKMLRAARRKNQGKSISLFQADGLFLPFSMDQFDNVFISFTLELFDTPEIPKVLNESHRVLKENGKLVVVSLAKQNTTAVRIYEWFHRRMPTLVDCRPIYLQPTLKEAGFKIEKSVVKTMWGLPVEVTIVRK